jgi:hypothetical protein
MPSRLADTENGVVVVWRGWCGGWPERFEGVGMAAQAIIDNPHTQIERIECIDRKSGKWRDCEDEVRDEIERLEQDADDWRRHQAGTRNMARP